MNEIRPTIAGKCVESDQCEELVREISTYVPAGQPPGWPRVAHEVQLAVATALPFTAYPATELMGVLTKLALFADAEGYPIQAELWLTREYIERFIMVGCAHLGDASRANYRSKLLRLREALVGGECVTGRPVRLTGSQASRPYHGSELAALWSWVCGQPTSELRDGLAVLMSLGLGCGLESHEIIHLRRRDLRIGKQADASDQDGNADDQPTMVAVRGHRGRLVVCRRAWEPILAVQAARAADVGAFLFRPAAKSRGGNLVTNFVARAHAAPETPGFKVSRLRATWLVSLIDAGLPLTVIVAAAGVKTLHGLSRLLPYLAPIQPTDAAQMVRDLTIQSNPR